MEIHEIFISTLAIDWLDVDNDKLATFCRDKAYNSEWYKNAQQSQSENLIDCDEFKELLKLVTVKLNEFHVAMGLSNNYTQEIFECWANVNSSKAISVPHLHQDSMFSCVYYVVGSDDTGSINFMNPVQSKGLIIQAKHIGTDNSFNIDSYNCTPVVGKLIIFPSYLYHYVNNFNGSERISIAFNSRFLGV